MARYSSRLRAKALAELKLKWEHQAENESPRRRFLALEQVYSVQTNAGLFWLVVFAIGFGFYMARVDVMSTLGGLIAVSGVWRFRRAYRDRVIADVKGRSSVARSGRTDQREVDRALNDLLRDAENNGAWLVVIGTMLSSSAGLLGSFTGWLR